MNHTSGILVKGKLLPETFMSIILAGQWAYAQGYSSDDYIAVLLLPNGEINHHAIIQVYDSQRGDIALENHYTTCGLSHLPMEKYEVDKAFYEAKYKDNPHVKVTAWVEY